MRTITTLKFPTQLGPFFISKLSLNQKQNKKEGQLTLSKRTFIAKQEVQVHHNPTKPNRAMQQTTTKFSWRQCNAEFLQHLMQSNPFEKQRGVQFRPTRSLNSNPLECEVRRDGVESREVIGTFSSRDHVWQACDDGGGERVTANPSYKVGLATLIIYIQWDPPVGPRVQKKHINAWPIPINP